MKLKLTNALALAALMVQPLTSFAQQSGTGVCELINQKNAEITLKQQEYAQAKSTLEDLQQKLDEAASQKKTSLNIAIPTTVVGTIGVITSTYLLVVRSGEIIVTGKSHHSGEAVGLLLAGSIITVGASITWMIIERKHYAAINAEVSEALANLNELSDVLRQKQSELETIKANASCE